MSDFLQTKTILISVLSLTKWIYLNDPRVSFYFPETSFRSTLTKAFAKKKSPSSSRHWTFTCVLCPLSSSCHQVSTIYRVVQQLEFRIMNYLYPQLVETAHAKKRYVTHSARHIYLKPAHRIMLVSYLTTKPMLSCRWIIWSVRWWKTLQPEFTHLVTDPG